MRLVTTEDVRAAPVTGPRLVAVVGPTASGKSELALRLARRFGGEIVGCDALQVYRGLDIGTGKVPASARRDVAHHLIDLIDPDEEFSAARYVDAAAAVVRDVARRGRLPLLVGGTGLYFRALRCGLFEGPGRVPLLRDRLAALAARRGAGFVHRLLARLDPASAARIHPNDTVRAVRALEVCLAARRPMSALQAERRPPLAEFSALVFGLAPDRETLRRRIEARVERMFAEGLVEEVRRVVDRYGPDAPALKAIGYREVLGLVRGELDPGEARRRTVRATVRYAKRQMTWFRREPGVVWIGGCGDEGETERRVARALEAGGLPIAEERLHAKTAS